MSSDAGGYCALAAYYDLLSQNIDRSRYLAYIIGAFSENGVEGTILDAGCGTGVMTKLLAARGYDVIGVDASEDMLAVAAAGSPDVLFLHQKLERLDLYGTVSGAVAVLDVVNHLNPSALASFWNRMALFIEPGGIFVFDMNLPYKHESVLAKNSFVFEPEDVMIVWQNELCRNPDSIRITLDIFRRGTDGRYMRDRDEFLEYTYTPEAMESVACGAGFTVLDSRDGETFLPLRPDSERIVYTVKRK